MKESNNLCKTNKYTVEYYSNKWINFDFNKLNKRVNDFEPLLKHILDRIKVQNSINILDIGTGPGTLPLAIINRFHKNLKVNIFGIDPSSVSISIASKIFVERNYNNHIIFKIGDFEKIPFPDHFFDSIVSNASFNLCTNKIKAIEEMVRTLKINGQIIIADCFKKKNYLQYIENDEKLWAHCISGAITTDWLMSVLNEKNLILTHKINLTKIVKFLILNDKWKWNDFIKYNLDYYCLDFYLK